MQGDDLLQNRATAVSDFNQARRQAALKDIMMRLSGKTSELLSYEDVRRQLKGRESARRTLEDIPVDAIIGSSARHQEFTRGFLPRKYIRPARWVGVKMAMTGMTGVPPIEVYRIGEAYFVQDGNHRVSVARQMGLQTIQAYVTEVHTEVSLDRNIRPEDLILIAEQTEFMERTGQKTVRPDANLQVSSACQYPELLEHISVHRYFMGLEQQREISFEEAFADWYDTVYLPLVQLIRERGLLRDFPGRTEADLYLWICRHRSDMEKALGWNISHANAASDLESRFGSKQPMLNPAGIRLLKVLTVKEADLKQAALTAPPVAVSREDHVVDDLLVAFSASDSGRRALQQALRVAHREGARLHGLHVVAGEAERDTAITRELRADFEQICRQSGIDAKLAIAVGPVVDRICERARWADLVVTSFTRPTKGLSTDAHRRLLRRCPRPVLTVPGEPSPLDRLLLAYDGSSKAEEALYIACYLSGWWHAALYLITVGSKKRSSTIQAHAQEYLTQMQIEAQMIHADGEPEALILQTANQYQCNLIMMGGYSLSTPLHVVLGSTVDGVLRNSPYPLLICQ